VNKRTHSGCCIVSSSCRSEDFAFPVSPCNPTFQDKGPTIWNSPLEDIIDKREGRRTSGEFVLVLIPLAVRQVRGESPGNTVLPERSAQNKRSDEVGSVVASYVFVQNLVANGTACTPRSELDSAWYDPRDSVHLRR
jgi:hypothetical protein